jgi:DNA-binding MarR family transcriptional regulator
MENTSKDLGTTLFLVSRAHHNKASMIFEQVGLKRGQPPILFKLGTQDGQTQTELAEKLELTTATLTNILQRMEMAGLVTRVREENDKRISRVYLTNLGRVKLDMARDSVIKIDRLAFDGFSPEERELLKLQLERVHHNLAKNI